MTILLLQGEFGEAFWERVKDRLDLLRHASTVKRMTGRDRANATIELTAWLARAGFGDDEVLANGFRSRFDYFEKLQRANPNSLRLFLSDREILARVRGNRASEFIRVGHAAGYSAVVPLTRVGFEGYLTNRISEFAMRDHLIGEDAPDTDQTYIHIEGLFHLPSIVRPEARAGRLEVIGEELQPRGLMQQLVKHVADHAPRLRVLRDSKSGEARIETKRGGLLPFLTAETNGQDGERLVSHAGFQRPSDRFSEEFPGLGFVSDITLEGYPKYVLDLSSLNRSGLNPRSRAALTRLTAMVASAQRETRRSEHAGSSKPSGSRKSRGSLTGVLSR